MYFGKSSIINYFSKINSYLVNLWTMGGRIDRIRIVICLRFFFSLTRREAILLFVVQPICLSNTAIPICHPSKISRLYPACRLAGLCLSSPLTGGGRRSAAFAVSID
jgi:hypothetical protein